MHGLSVFIFSFNHSFSYLFIQDLEHCEEQVDVLKLLQNEDVHCPGNYTHGLWGDPQSIQPCVSSLLHLRNECESCNVGLNWNPLFIPLF